MHTGHVKGKQQRKLALLNNNTLYNLSQKIPLLIVVVSDIFSKRLGIFYPNLLAYCIRPRFLSTLDYTFLFNYLQL